MIAAGFLAAYAAVIELQVAPVAAILGLALLAQVVSKDRPPAALGLFAVGAVIPTLIMMTYHYLAFGSPWALGYFYHAHPEFAEVHNRNNPLGLVFPHQFWHRLLSLLWGRYRGLLFYAPILWLTIPGWVVLLARRKWHLAAVTILAVAAVVLVNVCYPEWTGGWSTGPRLLVPLLPFAMLPVGALLAGDSRLASVATFAAGALGFAGGLLMLLFQGVDGRIPHDIADPLVEAVWPLWTGQLTLPVWRENERFAPNLVSLLFPAWTSRLGPQREALQFLPLVLFQAAGIVAIGRLSRSNAADQERLSSGQTTAETARAAAQTSNLDIDQN